LLGAHTPEQTLAVLDNHLDRLFRGTAERGRHAGAVGNRGDVSEHCQTAFESEAAVHVGVARAARCGRLLG
jgi:hypothetical protein